MKNYINTFEGFLNEANKMQMNYRLSTEDQHNVEAMWLKLSKDKSKTRGETIDAISDELKINWFEISSWIMKNYNTNESVVNESLRSGPNDAKIYPIKKGSDPEDLLSGRSSGHWYSSKTVNDLLDVFGTEMSIYKGDEIIEFLQVNSRDNSDVYKIIRRDMRGSRTVGYIPSYYQNFDQTEEINNTR